ncbi:hypothetical protein ACQEVZ_24630 [Dactylosporangium sp. CA-152071]|uniref:hypothetical protein n=1 Tax=Dactylosporangium sp. CA-152071 TaxID=3239933 RepID=UPI003D8D59C2
MTAKRYEFKLRRNQYETRLDRFTRVIDFDDQEQVSTFDGLLVRLMVDAVRRDGGKVRDLHEYDLQVREFGEGYVVMTFVASASEVPDELR